jgi:hypothetical protein
MLSTGDEGVSNIRSYAFLLCKNRPIGARSSNTEKRIERVCSFFCFAELPYSISLENLLAHIIRNLEISNSQFEQGIPLRDYQTLLIC